LSFSVPSTPLEGLPVLTFVPLAIFWNPKRGSEKTRLFCAGLLRGVNTRKPFFGVCWFQSFCSSLRANSFFHRCYPPPPFLPSSCFLNLLYPPNHGCFKNFGKRNSPTERHAAFTSLGNPMDLCPSALLPLLLRVPCRAAI